MNKSMIRRVIQLTAGIAAVSLIAAAPAQAKVTPKTGVYYQAIGSANGQLITSKGKIVSVYVTAKFKTPGGAFCQQGEFSTANEFSLVMFSPKKGLSLNSRNRFSVKNVAIAEAPGAKISVNGKFASANKVSFFAKVTIGNCKMTLNVPNAKYYAGG